MCYHLVIFRCLTLIFPTQHHPTPFYKIQSTEAIDKYRLFQRPRSARCLFVIYLLLTLLSASSPERESQVRVVVITIDRYLSNWF